MSKIKADHIFTSESVSEGHPDKVCDQISDAILDACLAEDPESRVAVETLCTTDLVVMAGEVATRAKVEWENIARNVIREIGYDDPSLGFSADACRVETHIHEQSPDISLGVTEGQGLHKESGAGDQGMMFGFACSETDELMPAPIFYAHKIVEELARIRKSGSLEGRLLRPDAKSQVSMRYHEAKPDKVETIVVSQQHAPEMERAELEALVRRVVASVIPARFLRGGETYHVNPTGRFVLGGPAADTGLTGRKIIVDTYGGVGSHGGGAFSGKDPTKVDRSAAYMCRYIAKNIVASGLAEKVEIQVAYAIGVAQPVSINLDTYGTGKIANDSILEKIVREAFDMTPQGIIRQLGLQHPQGWSYLQTARYGHYGRPFFPWEKTDRVEQLRALAAKLL